MSRVFFARELEGVATFWRIYRTDGHALGFISHDRDLAFGGILHRAAPGILPASLRKTDRLDGDSAEMQGPLGHWSISSRDLELGRFDDARVEVGAVDWETGEALTLYNGALGAISQDGGTFVAELQSAKASLEIDPVPRTSPSCRAQFCGPGCTLSAQRFSRRAKIAEVDVESGAVRTDMFDPAPYISGQMRWLAGPATGLTAGIDTVEGDWMTLAGDIPLSEIAVDTPVLLREGCDHTLATCASRFGNAVNFQGEPFLPGNDLLARYASSA